MKGHLEHPPKRKWFGQQKAGSTTKLLFKKWGHMWEPSRSFSFSSIARNMKTTHVLGFVLHPCYMILLMRSRMKEDQNPKSPRKEYRRLNWFQLGKQVILRIGVVFELSFEGHFGFRLIGKKMFKMQVVWAGELWQPQHTWGIKHVVTEIGR